MNQSKKPQFARAARRFVGALLGAALLLGALPLLAATCTANVASGNWSAAGTWTGCGGVTPTAADDVVIPAARTVTMDASPTIRTLNISGSLLIGSSTTARTLTVTIAGGGGNITINVGGSMTTNAFNATHSLVMNGDFVNNGTLNLATTTARVCNTTFNRAANQTISGTGATTVFNGIVVTLGTAQANILDVQAAGFTLASTGYVDINNGTFKISANIATIAPFDNAPQSGAPDYYIIPATGGFWLNSATTVNAATVTSYNVSVDGLFRISSGTFNLGRAADDRLRLRPTTPQTTLFQMDGGALNITGRLTSVNTTDNGTFTQSGGTITTGIIGNAIATFGAFFLGNATTFNMSGGTIIVQNISTGAGAGNNDYDVRSPTSTVTGGLVQIGSAASTAGQTFEVNSVAPVWDFTVNNTRTPTALLNSTLTVRDDLTIGAGSTLNSNNQSISVGNGNASGDWTNNGTFTQGTGTVTFTGTAAATLGGTTATTFNNFVINKAANNLAIATSPTINGTITFTSGDLVTGANRVILGTAAVVSSPSASSYVFGTVQKNYAAAGTLTFPVGDANNYAPVTIQGTAGFTAGSLSVNTTGADHPQVTTPIASTGIDASQSVNRYWTLTPSGLPAASVYNATFNFINATPVDLDAGVTTSSFIVQRYDGANWNPTTLGTAGATSTSITGVANVYGDFAIGEPLSNFNGAPGPFNAFETSTPSGAILGRIYTKLVGTSFQVSIVAVSNNAVNTSPAATLLTIAIIDASPTSGTLTAASNCRTSWTTVVQSQTLTPTWVSGRLNVTITAPAVAVRNARIRVTQGALVGCSTDNFAIRPTAFTITSTNANNTNTTGTPAITTGANFSLTATAVSGYDGTPALDNAKVTGTPTAGTVGGSFPAAVSGASTGSSFFYSEVGHFGLLANAVVDAGFTAVDQTADCVSSSTSNTLNGGGQYGCSIGSNAVVQAVGTAGFGRFIPANFAVSVNTPQLAAACAAGGFTYMGQPFVYTTQPVVTVTARNGTANGLTNATTVNYAGPPLGAPGSTYVKLGNSTLTPTVQGFPSVTTPQRYARFDALGGGTTPTLDTSNLPAVTGDPTISSFTAGVGTLTFSSGTGLFFTRSTTTPTLPFNADIGLSINVIDLDNVQFAGNPATFGAATATNGISFGGATANAMRYGRMRIANSFGSTLLDLPQVVSAEYFNSSSVFQLNTDDSCTTLVASNIRMSAVAGNPDLSTTCKTSLSPTGTISFSSGKASLLKLTKPGAGNNGSVNLTINLDGTSSGNTCTPTSTSVTNAAKTWLQGNWESATYNANPTGTATFGVFKSADEFIYLREVF